MPNAFDERPAGATPGRWPDQRAGPGADQIRSQTPTAHPVDDADASCQHEGGTTVAAHQLATAGADIETQTTGAIAYTDQMLKSSRS